MKDIDEELEEIEEIVMCLYVTKKKNSFFHDVKDFDG